jgi:K+-sensing histidine kinase KdpD
MVLALLALVWGALAWRRATRAERAEHLAAERRDRFVAVVAGELDAPLASLHAQVAGLEAGRVSAERLAVLARGVDELRTLVAEAARLPARPAAAALEQVDLAELVREIVAAPPFGERGPSVVVRASAARVLADRSRLLGGLRILLWTLRREARADTPLVITISSDEESAWVEIDTQGGAEAAESLERLPGVAYGMGTPSGAAGSTLALQVASEVARVHGGRLTAAARAAAGERFVLELPTLPLGRSAEAQSRASH